MPVDLDRLKASLSDVPGLNSLSVTEIAGRKVYGFNGVIAAVDPKADEVETERAIRKAAAMVPPKLPEPIVRMQPSTPTSPAAIVTSGLIDMQAPPRPSPLPSVSIQPASPKPMTTPAPGSFSASLKAMLDEARAGVEQARADGLTKVTEAVGKLNDVKASTSKVAAGMAKQIEDEAASALSDLGQISNEI